MVTYMPLSPEADIETPEAAQRALLLESYYGLLEATLKGQELFLAPWTATKDPDARAREAEAWRRKAADEQAHVQAVQERGDWRPLKEKWSRRIPPDARASDGEDTASAWLREMTGRVMREVRGHGAIAHAYERARRVLALVPDQTAPVRAAAVDPDPPLL